MGNHTLKCVEYPPNLLWGFSQSKKNPTAILKLIEISGGGVDRVLRAKNLTESI